MKGVVRTPAHYGHLPIKDTTITWRIDAGEGKQLGGTLMTDGNGEFEVYVQTDLLGNAPAAMTIEVKRSSGAIQHTYECDDVPCTERTVYVQPLSFGTFIEFSDVSVVPITYHWNRVHCHHRAQRVC